MSSILDYKVLPLPSSDQRFFSAAEQAAHDAAMSIASEIPKCLPERMHNLALGIAVTGLISAIGRLIAQYPVERGDAIARNMTLVIENEVAHWRRHQAAVPTPSLPAH
jgi:hypothetical protein